MAQVHRSFVEKQIRNKSFERKQIAKVKRGSNLGKFDSPFVELMFVVREYALLPSNVGSWCKTKPTKSNNQLSQRCSCRMTSVECNNTL